MKTTFDDSIQYASSLWFRFIGFAIVMSVLISLWNFIYSEPGSTISGYTFNQMIWYLLLAEIITFGSGSKVATDEIRDTIKNDYCKKNNINLIRIPYWEFDNIEKILNRELNLYK